MAQQLLGTQSLETKRNVDSNFVMSASPDAPSSDVANITVTWSGVSSPQSSDWIAQYCVGAPLAEWLEWAYVDVAPSYRTGAGNMTFTVFRTSCNYEFRMYRDPSPYVLLGSSNAIAWSGPYHVHVAYGSQPQTQITVSWSTNSSQDPAILFVGTKPGVYDLPSVTAQETVTYLSTDMCEVPSTSSFLLLLLLRLLFSLLFLIFSIAHLVIRS